MENKWFHSAALAGSGFEHLADEIVEFNQLTTDKIKDIDLLFTDKPSLFFSKFKGSYFTVVCDKKILPEEQEMYLLENPGNFFISRLGHDITNLFFPFEHFEYLEENMIQERTRQGIRLGKQINIIGHLLQKTVSLEKDPADIDEVIQVIQSLCRKKNMQIEITGSTSLWKAVLPDFRLLNYVIEEIIFNWLNHGVGGYKLEINEKSLVFSNSFDGDIDLVRTKAKLRCPFRKKNTGSGAGLGLYIVSLVSVRGGFDWDISVKEKFFSLSLIF